LEIKRVEISSSLEWRNFLKNSYHLFYDDNFLEYNKIFNKISAWHHLIILSENRTICIINGNERYDDGLKTYVSCDGVSFGGFLWNDKCKIDDYLEAIQLFKAYLKENDFKKCIIRNSPSLYQDKFDEEYEYSLLQEGFTNERYSITNIITLNNFNFDKLSNPKKRSINKSSKNIDIEIINNKVSEESLKDFYNLLLKNRERKDAKPTHTLNELVYLKNTLPDKIILFQATMNRIIAGICVLFVIKEDVILNFYLAADEEHKKDRVSDYLLYKSIEWSKANNFRIYDIGTSNLGRQFLQGLFEFKKKFMADGFLRKTYTILL